jgi:hypothetical protein
MRQNPRKARRHNPDLGHAGNGAPGMAISFLLNREWTACYSLFVPGADFEKAELSGATRVVSYRMLVATGMGYRL